MESVVNKHPGDPRKNRALACCALHKFLRNRLPTYTNNLLDAEDEVSHDVTPGEWRNDAHMISLEVMRGANMTNVAKAQRDYLCEWVNG